MHYHSYSLHGFMIDCERCLYDCYLPALIETKQESNASLSFFHPHPHLYIYLSIYLCIHPSNTTNQRWCAYSCFCRLCKALWPSGRKMFVVTFAWVGLYDSRIHNFFSHHLTVRTVAWAEITTWIVITPACDTALYHPSPPMLIELAALLGIDLVAKIS